MVYAVSSTVQITDLSKHAGSTQFFLRERLSLFLVSLFCLSISLRLLLLRFAKSPFFPYPLLDGELIFQPKSLSLAHRCSNRAVCKSSETLSGTESLLTYRRRSEGKTIREELLSAECHMKDCSLFFPSLPSLSFSLLPFAGDLFLPCLW